jgi:hypothetical protein
MKIDFQFDVDDLVVVKGLGITGIVSMCAIDGPAHEKTYYIKSGTSSDWYAERLCRPATDAETCASASK